MTKITIFRNHDGEYLGFDCLGHAGYADEGEDIVCAGISALVINTINSIGLFTENAETIAAGGTALRIISAGFIISSVSVTASGALEGLGKGTQSLVISLFRYVILMIPAAFVLCRIFGPTGVWHAFWITEAVTSVIAAYVYHT